MYVTADARVVAHAHVADDVRGFLDRTVDFANVQSSDVALLSDAAWTPGVEDVSLALSCAECGNTVTDEGESESLDGERYHFCCPPCRERFVERYEDLAARADAETP